jgi:hypothetical protein
LDVNGNGELVTIMNYRNLDGDFMWFPSTMLKIPIRITSFSKEKANLTELSFGDNHMFNYSISNYTISPEDDYSSYIHEYVIEVSPRTSRPITISKNSAYSLRTITKINGISTNMGAYNKFIFNLYNKKFQSYIIRVILPNDPYYWDEILYTDPIYHYRTSFGNGESIEWQFDENINRNNIYIDYSIHPDELKKEIDDIAEKAFVISWISLVLGIIAIKEDLKKLLKSIKEFWEP